MPIPLLALAALGGAMGLAKNKADQQREAQQRQEAAEIMRWSPWTGMQPGPVQQAGDPMSSALQGAMGGALMGQGLGLGGGAAEGAAQGVTQGAAQAARGAGWSGMKTAQAPMQSSAQDFAIQNPAGMSSQMSPMQMASIDSRANQMMSPMSQAQMYQTDPNPWFSLQPRMTVAGR